MVPRRRQRKPHARPGRCRCRPGALPPPAARAEHPGGAPERVTPAPGWAGGGVSSAAGPRNEPPSASTAPPPVGRPRPDGPPCRGHQGLPGPSAGPSTGVRVKPVLTVHNHRREWEPRGPATGTHAPFPAAGPQRDAEGQGHVYSKRSKQSSCPPAPDRTTVGVSAESGRTRPTRGPEVPPQPFCVWDDAPTA